MEQVCRILTNPVTSTKTVEPLELPRQWLNGSIYPITEATMYAYDGDTIIASGTLVDSTLTISGIDNNALIYNWTSAEIDYLSQYPKAHYRSVWTLNNNNRRTEEWFGVGYWKLNSTLDEQDLLLEKPEITLYRPEINKWATLDSSGVLLHCDVLSEPSHFYDGSLIVFKGGDNSGREYRVKTWDYLARTFELSDTLPYIVRKNNVFTLRRSYNPEITSAWSEILAKIQTWTPIMNSEYGVFRSIPFINFTQSQIQQIGANRNGLNWAVDGQDFRQLHLYGTMTKICSALRMRDKDAFDLWYDEYSTAYERAMNDLKAKVDSSRDGVFDEKDTEFRGGSWFRH